MKRTVIRNGTVRIGERYLKRDLVIRGQYILECAETIECRDQDAVIDAGRCLVIPGLINSHLHSHDNFNKAYDENSPLEIWMPLIRPFFSGVRHTPREIYLRTMIGAIEMLKSGTTAVMDDVLLNHVTDEENLRMVMQAYNDIGMRAVVCPHIKNIPMEKTIPYAEDFFTPEMKKATNVRFPSEAEILDYLEKQIREYNDGERSVTVGLSASAPQRCTIPLLQGMKELSEKYDVPLVSHVLETYVQKKTGDLFYGKSLVEYLADNDLLYPNLVLIHCNWVNDKDISLIRDKGCRVVHNPASNMKMGSGIAPVRKMKSVIPVGLGTDNISANDSANMFESMKLGCLLNKISSPDYRQWLRAADYLEMATSGGSRCILQGKELGAVEEGMKADLVILRSDNERMICASDFDKCLVYAENGRSVDTVLVDGEVVVAGGKLTKVDEDELFQEIGVLRSMIGKEHALAEKECVGITEVFARCYWECNKDRFDPAAPPIL